MPKVREATCLVERDGWTFERMKGDHRIYKHPVKPGIAVIAGAPSKDLAEGTWQAIVRQAGLKVNRGGAS